MSVDILPWCAEEQQTPPSPFFFSNPAAAAFPIQMSYMESFSLCRSFSEFICLPHSSMSKFLQPYMTCLLNLMDRFSKSKDMDSQALVCHWYLREPIHGKPVVLMTVCMKWQSHLFFRVPQVVLEQNSLFFFLISHNSPMCTHVYSLLSHFNFALQCDKYKCAINFPVLSNLCTGIPANKSNTLPSCLVSYMRGTQLIFSH